MKSIEIKSPLAKEIFNRVGQAIKESGRSYIWKRQAQFVVKNIYHNGKFDVDYFVDFLIDRELNASPWAVTTTSVEHRRLLLRALFQTIIERVNEGVISDRLLQKAIDMRWEMDFFSKTNDAEKRYLEKYGRNPPAFVLISPGKHCNLNCTGCYASSTSRTKDYLDYSTVRKIIEESHEQWGARLVDISGGEPLMYRSDGRSILDLAKDLPHMYFKVFTNGTLINNETAELMASIGNVSPTISIEGTQQDTDFRRGKGVFKKALAAMDNLRKSGVPFGVSITATRNNIDTLLNEEYYDYLFEDLKITYGWIFEYMPVGRGAETGLMPTPEERRQLFDLIDTQNRKGRFICDFWSSSPSAEGCLAAGRSYGYMYINWNGDVVPCVFNPYSDTNIKGVYESGGTLSDAVENSKLFQEIRAWQQNYGFCRGDDVCNLMTPCPMRDHFKEYKEILLQSRAKPIDEAAALALSDPDYYDKMVKYGDELERQMKPVWDHRFCGM